MHFIDLLEMIHLIQAHGFRTQLAGWRTQKFVCGCSICCLSCVLLGFSFPSLLTSPILHFLNDGVLFVDFIVLCQSFLQQQVTIWSMLEIICRWYFAMYTALMATVVLKINASGVTLIQRQIGHFRLCNYHHYCTIYSLHNFSLNFCVLSRYSITS